MSRPLSKKKPAARRQKLLKKTRGITRLALLLVLVAVFGLLVLVAAERQNLLDWWQLRGYQAPAPVAQLADQDTMTAYGRKVFYVNHPKVDDSKQTFSVACPSSSHEQTIVLGCYHGGQAGIFIFGVSDPRLQGVEQVTAAHEMLHAAYDRLSNADRQKIDKLLTDYYTTDLHDRRVLTTIAAYKQSEPHDVVNEMHSVFGTEIANLPPALEQYYRRYFTNRAAVTSMAAQYQGEFTSRQTRVAEADAQLSVIKTQIETAESDLKSKQAAISAQQAALVAERNGGDVNAYNAGVPAFNKLVVAYNAELGTVQGLISQYNQLVIARNATALEQDQLVHELSGAPAPINH